MRVAFACSSHVGHLNPTLPLVEALAEMGHEVHYMCFESARAKIVKAGAVFHDCATLQTEHYAGNAQEPTAAMALLMEEHELDKASFLSVMKVSNLCLERELPGTLRFLQHLRPDVLVYDPLLFCRHAGFAAKILGIPAVGLLTIAGPGAMKEHSPASMKPLTIADLDVMVRDFGPHENATKRLNDKYNIDLAPGLFFPDGYMDTCLSNNVMVTTSENLKDPMTPDLEHIYQKRGTSFAYVGPLISEGTKAEEEESLLQKIRQARADGVPVIAVSMGTVLISDHPVMGWNTRSGLASIRNCDLCRAVWAGTFDALGCESSDGALIIAAVGLQAEPLGYVNQPANAVCMQALPQVAILREGIDLFVTHGGQNSFTEAIANGTPVIVCPGFGDQLVNARKAADLGVGLKVERPVVSLEEKEESAAASYRLAVSQAVQAVMSQSSFKKAAMHQCDLLQKAGGVPRAVEIVVAAGSESGARIARASKAGA